MSESQAIAFSKGFVAPCGVFVDEGMVPLADLRLADCGRFANPEGSGNLVADVNLAETGLSLLPWEEPLGQSRSSSEVQRAWELRGRHEPAHGELAPVSAQVVRVSEGELVPPRPARGFKTNSSTISEEFVSTSR